MMCVCVFVFPSSLFPSTEEEKELAIRTDICANVDEDLAFLLDLDRWGIKLC